MDIDSLSDWLYALISSHSGQMEGAFDVNTLISGLSVYGIDLTMYSPEEITEALAYAFSVNTVPITDNALLHYDGVTFEGNSNNIPNDISYYERKQRDAEGNIEYYTRELRRSGLSKTYREDCHRNLQQAIKKTTEIAKRIKDLKDQLGK